MADGPQADREAMVLRHLPLVRYVANRVRLVVPGVLDVDDYVSLGAIGLLEAVDRYQPERGVSFGVFAYSRIKGAIWDGIRRVTHSRSCNGGEPMLSLEEPISCIDGDILTLGDTISDPRSLAPEVAAERAEFWQMEGIDQRDRAVVALYHWSGFKFREIGQVFGIDESRASQLHTRAMKRLRRELKELGVD